MLERCLHLEILTDAYLKCVMVIDKGAIYAFPSHNTFSRKICVVCCHNEPHFFKYCVILWGVIRDCNQHFSVQERVI